MKTDKTNTTPQIDAIDAEAVIAQTAADFKNSVLIVSVLLNLFILTTWLVIQVSPVHSLSAVGM